MTEATNGERRSEKELPQYIYSLHGIRTNAYWQSELLAEIKAKTEFEVGYRNYRRFDLMMFVLKNIFCYRPLRLVEGDLRELQKRYRVSVIAHSFGTWLILKALSENTELKIQHLILCGAIFPRAQSGWRQLKHHTGQITGNIVNYCGTRDPFPALAELLSRDFGASGVTGAGDPSVADSFHNVGHSGFLTAQFCSANWVSLLQGKALALQPTPLKPRGYINMLLWAAAHRGLLLVIGLLLVVSGYWFYGSEWSCTVRPCTVDIVRVHNFASSTRAKGERRYVNQVTFEYSFNFNAPNFIFRAPKDRNPVVMSFLGPQSTPVKPVESSVTIQTTDGVQERIWQNFTLPVLDRRAYFSSEFANESDEAPDGLAILSDRIIRNLRTQIILPPGVSLIAPKREFRRGLLIDRVPASEEQASRCNVDADGTALRCTDLNLPPRTEFFYCFVVMGWNAPNEIQPSKIAACQPEAQKKPGGTTGAPGQ